MRALDLEDMLQDGWRGEVWILRPSMRGQKEKRRVLSVDVVGLSSCVCELGTGYGTI